MGGGARRRAAPAGARRGGARGQLQDLGRPPGREAGGRAAGSGPGRGPPAERGRGRREESEVQQRREIKEPAEEGADEEPGDEKELAVKWRRMERARRFESRRVQLPPDADVEKVQASLADGVLLLSVPKKPEPTSRRVEIH